MDGTAKPPTWRDGLKVHPAAELLPMMTEAELDELAADIAEHGLQQPIVMTSKGLLDGRNRLAAIYRIKDAARRAVLMRDLEQSKRGAVNHLLWMPDDPVAYVLSANLHRRHLTPEQKREVIARVLKAQPERSDRAIGKLAQASPTTVGKVRVDLEGAGELSRLDSRIGADGKTRPTPKSEPAPQPMALPPIESFVLVEQWGTLDDATKAALLAPDPSRVPRFNKQESDSIEWAMWSWNPITGCLHNCPYCYARDIATSPRMAEAYPYKFAPVLCPPRLLTPRTMRVPLEADRDSRYRNVFTCSMADMFGRWVPAEWIEAVFGAMRDAPDWNFLCLTKFPKRMAEFDIPANAWMGTTVDLQDRVAAAEAAFAKVPSTVRWLSCEPLLKPLRFKHLDRFHWIVIGGASRSNDTPEWHPPFEWVVDLVQQARAAGVKVYFKTNLLHSRILELPFDAPIVADPVEAPAVFHYLSSKAAAE